MSWCSSGDKLDMDIFDAMTVFVGQLLQRGEQLADRFQVPVSCMKAMRRLDPATTMKDLSQRLHCDPSFVTMIADALEERGLARREPNPLDRRIKNLVLTSRGLELKTAIEQEMLGEMPWSALDAREREQLLGLVRKMTSALDAKGGQPGVASQPAGAGALTEPACAEEVSNAANSLPVAR